MEFIKQFYPDFGKNKWYFNNSDEIFPHFCQAFERRVKWSYLLLNHSNEIQTLPKDLIGLEKILNMFGDVSTRNNGISTNYNIIKSIVKDEWAAAEAFLCFGDLHMNKGELRRENSAYTQEYRLSYLEDNSGMYVETRFESTLRDRLSFFKGEAVAMKRNYAVQIANGVNIPYMQESIFKTAMAKFLEGIGGWRYSLNSRDRSDLLQVLMVYVEDLIKCEDMEEAQRKEIPFWAFKCEPPPTQEMLLLEPGKETPEENFIIRWEDLGATRHTKDQTNQRRYANDCQSLKTWQKHFGDLAPGTEMYLSDIREKITSGSTIKRAEELGIIEFARRDGRKKIYRLSFLDYSEKGEKMINYEDYNDYPEEGYQFYNY